MAAAIKSARTGQGQEKDVLNRKLQGRAITPRAILPKALQRGEFSAEDIAAELGLSKRTLQRRLSMENITFKELLDLYRQEQARLLLQNGARDMGRVAYALGYSEQSSFNRAFRRWAGQSPSAWLLS
ncbi:MAG: helix-turn-helix transcriptional regulator [Chloroflexota bacterium]